MHPGKIIQNYRLLRFLGDGGMGSVWLAEHTLLQRQVAIKSLHGQLLRNQGIRERFKNEAATLAHLQHERIVALHDYIEDDEGAYLVMEFVDGIALDDYIRDVSGPIPDAQLRDLLGQILEGFVYAHGKRVVHRDIKPGNFLITPDGKVKILDFGIAKILGDGDRKLTKTGTNMGTVLFMSPEQVKGQVVDQRSDIYALGVTLFQMATGRNPYAADMTEFYVYDQIVNHPLPPAREFYPGVTPHIEALIAKATAKVPEERFLDVGAFLGALRNGNMPEEKQGEDLSVSEEEGGKASGSEENPPRRITVDNGNEPSIVAEEKAQMDAAEAQQVSESLSGEEANEPAVVATVTTPAPARKRRRAWPWVLLMLLALGVGGYFLLPIVGIGSSGAGTLYVVPEDMHLWKKADKTGDLGTVPEGAALQVVADAAGGWKQVEWNRKTGYVNGNLLVPFEEYQIIRHAMDAGMKKWLNKSYLRISLAHYFHAENLHADLPTATYNEVYGQSKGDEEVWKATATPREQEYNTVIRGVQLDAAGSYTKDGRQMDNVVILNSNKGHRKLVAFKHVKVGDGYKSTVLAEKDITEFPKYEIRIATNDKLRDYNFEGKTDVQRMLNKGQYPILLAHPETDSPIFLLLLKGGEFETIEVSPGVWGM